MKKILLALPLMTSIAYADNISVSAATQPATCQLSHRCDLFATHDIEIINTTDQNHLYIYSYSLCGDNSQCVVIGNRITVAAHSKWNNHYDSHVIAAFEYTGTHLATAKTSISGTTEAQKVDEKQVEVK